MAYTCPTCGAPLNPGELFCGRCGTKLQQTTYSPQPPVSPQPHTAVVASKSDSSKLLLVLTIVLSVLVIALAIFGVSQFSRIKDMEKDLKSAGINAENVETAFANLQSDNQILTNDLNAANQALAEYEETLAEYEDVMELAEYHIDMYDTLLTFLQEPDAGYAAEYFHSVRPVYVMHVGDAPATFTLTADFTGAVTISMSSSGYSADVGFVDSSFYDTTPVQIDPIEPGITYMTFTNSVNDLSFRVMVLVLE